MSGQYFGDKPFVPSDNDEGSDRDIDNPEVNPSHFTDDVPANDDIVPETPMDETIAEDNPVEETIVHEDILLGESTMPYTTPPLVDETIAEESVVSRSISYNAPMDETSYHETTVNPPVVLPTAILNREESEQFRTRWNEIQGKFVDEPRSAVQEADALVTEVIDQVTQMFSTEHSSLESQWKAGDTVSTEDLRKALQRYRSFFNRLVV